MIGRLTRRDVIVLLLIGVATAAILLLGQNVKERLALPAALTVVCSLFAGLVLCCYRSALQALQRHSDNSAQERARENQNLFSQIEALLHIQKFIQWRQPLPAMREWAVSPDFAILLASEIIRCKPETIVELGCGTSTLISGYCLEKLGRGRVFSLEHERKYAGACRENVKAHGLEAFATVCDAPLCDIDLGGKTWKYYDLSSLRNVSPIDVLVVDGPPWSVGRLARYPALPLFYNQLGEAAVILVDDADRADDRAIIERWIAEHPDLECTFLDLEKGAAVLRRRPAGRS